MTALPDKSDVFNGDWDANAKSLYTIVHDAEQAARTAQQAMHSRIVGYLLLDPLSSGARSQILKEVASCNAKSNGLEDLNEAIYGLGQHYLTHFIRPFKQTKGQTPASSSHVSRRSFDLNKQSIKTDLVQTPPSHDTAKQLALRRDNYRCMISGLIDDASAEAHQDLGLGSHAKGYVFTQCCHILPKSTNNFNVKEKADKLEYAAGVWAVLKCFGYPEILDEVAGARAHRLENILTLAIEAHAKMDNLKLWFEEVAGKDNCYRVKSIGQGTKSMLQRLGAEEEVTFVTQDTTLPLPSPKYLRIHAACCRVAHMSGAGEYLDKVSRDIEKLPVLAADGASGDLLARALGLVAPT